MLPHQDTVAEVLDAPDGPTVGAFFDFDGTLISGYSAVAFLQEQVKRGNLSPRELMELVSAMISFGLGNLGFSAMMIAASQFLRGVHEDSYASFGEELFRSHIARQIYPEARALVDAHLKKGHTVAIISSATPYQVVPSARELGIEHVMCTRLEVEKGYFTGAVVQPTCFGEGKVTAAESLAAEHGVDLEQTFFYSDSDDDIQLLERIGKPRPLNPNAKLTMIAESRGLADPALRQSRQDLPERLGAVVVSADDTAGLVRGGIADMAAQRFEARCAQLLRVRVCRYGQRLDRAAAQGERRRTPVVATARGVHLQSPE